MIFVFNLNNRKKRGKLVAMQRLVYPMMEQTTNPTGHVGRFAAALAAKKQK